PEWPPIPPTFGGRRETRRPPLSPSIPEPRREVALAEVVEERHETTLPFAARDLFDAREIRARRLPDEESGLRQAAAHRVRVVRTDRHELVDHALVQDRGHDVFRAAERLEPLDARER